MPATTQPSPLRTEFNRRARHSTDKLSDVAAEAASLAARRGHITREQRDMLSGLAETDPAEANKLLHALVRSKGASNTILRMARDNVAARPTESATPVFTDDVAERYFPYEPVSAIGMAPTSAPAIPEPILSESGGSLPAPPPSMETGPMSGASPWQTEARGELRRYLTAPAQQRVSLIEQAAKGGYSIPYEFAKLAMQDHVNVLATRQNGRFDQLAKAVELLTTIDQEERLGSYGQQNIGLRQQANLIRQQELDLNRQRLERQELETDVSDRVARLARQAGLDPAAMSLNDFEVLSTQPLPTNAPMGGDPGAQSRRLLIQILKGMNSTDPQEFQKVVRRARLGPSVARSQEIELRGARKEKQKKEALDEAMAAVQKARSREEANNILYEYYDQLSQGGQLKLMDTLDKLFPQK